MTFNGPQLAFCIASETPKTQGHCKSGAPGAEVPGQSQEPTGAKLDCPFVENALVFILPNIWGARVPLRDPLYTYVLKFLPDDFQGEIADGGGLGCLINNAGVSPKAARYNRVTPEQMSDTFAVNATAPLLLARYGHQNSFYLRLFCPGKNYFQQSLARLHNAQQEAPVKICLPWSK